MVRASDLEPGKIYVPTRPRSGFPNTFYLVLEDKAVRRVTKRLSQRTRLDARDARTLASALRGDVILKRVARRVSDDGRRVETTQLLGLRPADEVRLRSVKHKPGYTRANHPGASNKPTTGEAASAL